MHLDLPILFCRHVAVSFGKQLHLSNLVGNRNWHFDTASGLLSFEDVYRWHVQLLGTEAHGNWTWLWAWANETSRIPTQFQGAALTLRLLGQCHNIPELIEPQLPLDTVNGYILATIASGVCRADAYYRCPYDGGAAFLLVKDDSFPGSPEKTVARLATVFPQALSAAEIPDHRLALSGWLDYYGIARQEEAHMLIVRSVDEPVLTAQFDDQNRLTHLEFGANAANKA